MTAPTLSAGTTSRNTLVPGHPGHRGLPASVSGSSPSPFFSTTAAGVIGDGCCCCCSGSGDGKARDGVGGSGSESEDGYHGSTSSGSSSSSSWTSTKTSSSSAAAMAERSECEGEQPPPLSVLGFSGWLSREPLETCRGSPA
ncbi:hypothetical protein BS78_04G021700 [Paspalum vaginatum]|nr:hypothetical protein BS78_04G021700 [Paspalum vaginatum]